MAPSAESPLWAFVIKLCRRSARASEPDDDLVVPKTLRPLRRSAVDPKG